MTYGDAVAECLNNERTDAAVETHNKAEGEPM